jgi:hypothetical protein
MENRRTFLKKISAAGVALPFTQYHAHGAVQNQQKSMHPICYFTKHLQWLDFDEL